MKIKTYTIFVLIYCAGFMVSAQNTKVIHIPPNYRVEETAHPKETKVENRTEIKKYEEKKVILHTNYNLEALNFRYESFLDTLNIYRYANNKKYSELKSTYDALKNDLMNINPNDERIFKLDEGFKKVINVLELKHDTIPTNYEYVLLPPPSMPLPLPLPSADGPLNLNIFKNASTYKQINEILEDSLDHAGFSLNELRYFLLKDENKTMGYSIMTPLEIISEHGAHLSYLAEANQNISFSNFSFDLFRQKILEILNKITFQNTQYIRSFIFTVTSSDTIITDYEKKASLDSLQKLFPQGAAGFSLLKLSNSILSNYAIRVLVYQFKRTQFNQDVIIVVPSEVDLKSHLKAFHLDNLLKKSNNGHK